jgi:hypothetical protein
MAVHMIDGGEALAIREQQALSGWQRLATVAALGTACLGGALLAAPAAQAHNIVPTAAVTGTDQLPVPSGMLSNVLPAGCYDGLPTKTTATPANGYNAQNTFMQNIGYGFTPKSPEREVWGLFTGGGKRLIGGETPLISSDPAHPYNDIVEDNVGPGSYDYRLTIRNVTYDMPFTVGSTIGANGLCPPAPKPPVAPKEVHFPTLSVANPPALPKKTFVAEAASVKATGQTIATPKVTTKTYSESHTTTAHTACLPYGEKQSGPFYRNHCPAPVRHDEASNSSETGPTENLADRISDDPSELLVPGAAGLASMVLVGLGRAWVKRKIAR